MDDEIAYLLYQSFRNTIRLLNTYEIQRKPEDLDLLVYWFERLYRLLMVADYRDDVTIANMGKSLSFLEEMCSSSCCIDSTGFVPRLISYHHRGRPRFDIRKAQLEYLLQMKFSCRKIASLIGVSRSTIRRRMDEYGLSVAALYSDISDHELDRIVSEIKRNFPNCGFRLMEGHLLRRGIRIPQHRVRDCFHRLDPDGVAIRWAATIQRRKYSVASPLSLWHLDGNHKLIR